MMEMPAPLTAVPTVFARTPLLFVMIITLALQMHVPTGLAPSQLLIAMTATPALQTVATRLPVDAHTLPSTAMITTLVLRRRVTPQPDAFIRLLSAMIITPVPRMPATRLPGAPSLQSFAMTMTRAPRMLAIRQQDALSLL